MSEDIQPFRYEPIALSNESTVVAEFQPDAWGCRHTSPKLNWKREFIMRLQVQGL